MEVRGAVGAGRSLGEDGRGLDPAWGWWEEGEVPRVWGGPRSAVKLCGSRQSSGAFIHPLDLRLWLLTNIAAARRPPAKRRSFLFHKTVL